MVIRHTSHARYDLWYHYAWSTKYRKKIFLDKHIQQRVKELFRTIASHYDIELGEVNCCMNNYAIALLFIRFTQGGFSSSKPSRGNYEVPKRNAFLNTVNTDMYIPKFREELRVGN